MTLTDAGPQTGPSTLPVLDLSRLDDGGRAEFVDRLRAATRDFGFFYLVGHGIPGDLQSRLLEVARAFFALPEASKLAIEKVHNPHYRGYSRLGGELTGGVVDRREQIDIGPEQEPLPTGPGQPDWATLVGPNPWPAELPEFRVVLQDWERALEAVARRLLGAWLEALGQPADLLDGAFTPANQLIKVVRYPGRPDEDATPAAGSSDQGVGAHKDSGVLTLLFVEPGRPGLEVRHDDRWVPVPPLPDALIVNIGEMLETATGGYLQATDHRVVSNSGTADRISVPYFFNPRFDSTFPIWDLPPDLAAVAQGVSTDPANPIHAQYGENAIKSRVRSHPDVAQRHHPHLIGKYDG